MTVASGPSGKSLGCVLAYVISELILPLNVPPPGSGKPAISRGKLIIATSPVVGSMLTTIRVSVSDWVRSSAESTPTRRTLIRAVGDSGVAIGATFNSSVGPAVVPGSRDDGVLSG